MDHGRPDGLFGRQFVDQGVLQVLQFGEERGRLVEIPFCGGAEETLARFFVQSH